jgi:hypothetical protein
MGRGRGGGGGARARGGLGSLHVFGRPISHPRPLGTAIARLIRGMFDALQRAPCRSRAPCSTHSTHSTHHHHPHHHRRQQVCQHRLGPTCTAGTRANTVASVRSRPPPARPTARPQSPARGGCPVLPVLPALSVLPVLPVLPALSVLPVLSGLSGPSGLSGLSGPSAGDTTSAPRDGRSYMPIYAIIANKLAAGGTQVIRFVRSRWWCRSAVDSKPRYTRPFAAALRNVGTP